MEQQEWKYAAFMQFYEAWNTFYVRTNLEISADAYNGFLQSPEWNELPLEAQNAASIFLAADEKETEELPFLLEEKEARAYYLRFCRENYSAGREIPAAALSYWQDQFEQKEFSTLIAPLGHRPRYSGILRKQAGRDILLFPFFAEGLASSRYLLSLITRTLLQQELPHAQWIGFLHLYEREAAAAGVETTLIALQLEQLMEARLEREQELPRRKDLLLQRVLFHFRSERPEDAYIHWDKSKYRQTGIALNQLAAFLDRAGMELELEEWAVGCWIRFVLLRAREYHEEALQQARLVLENAGILERADRFAFLGGLATVPVNREPQELVLRRLQNDFQDIVVSFLLEDFVAREDYPQGYQLLSRHDLFFRTFLHDYHEAVKGKPEEDRREQETAAVKALFRAQQERLRVVLGDNWLLRVQEVQEAEDALGATAGKDAFQWIVKYIYNAMNTFHKVGEEELGVFMNKIYLRLLLPE